MNRQLREKYKYTRPESLTSSDLPHFTGDMVLIEANRKYIRAVAPTAKELSSSVESLAQDPLVAENLNTAQPSVRGVQIRIPDHVSETCGMVNIHFRYDPGQENHRAVIRNVVHLEENTRTRLFVHHHPVPAGGNINALTVIRLEKGANLELIEITETKAILSDTVIVEQAEESVFVNKTIDLNNERLRRNQYVNLAEARSECDLGGVYVTDEQQHCDNYVQINHRVPDCKSTQLFKGVAGEQSTAIFTGSIVVAPDAQRTAAYQQNHNIVLSDNARVFTRPQLEIYADDVKCSHGATVGMLDTEAIYYMRQRGISEGAAKRLQIEGFMSEIVEQSPSEDVEHSLHGKISHRLQEL